MDHYILTDDRRVVIEPDPEKWAKWMNDAERHVADERFGGEIVIPAIRRFKERTVPRIRVSTVFLGLDHGWGDGPPVLWETMIFAHGEAFDQYQRRCSGSWEQAEMMHMETMAWLRTQIQLDYT